MVDDVPVEYDMSFSTNARINYLLWLCNEASSEDDPLKWMKACKNILKEASIKMKDEELKEHLDHLSGVERGMNSFNKYVSSYSSQKNKPMFEPPREVFDLLYTWELLLRKKLDKMGLLLKQGDDLSRVMV